MFHLKRSILYSMGVFIITLSMSGRTVLGDTSPTSIGGIYALGSASDRMPETVFTNAYIDGVALRYWWRNLEPGDKVYDWSPIDRDIAIARAHGKKVSLSIAAGFGTPPWVYSANVAQFTFRWTKSWGAPPCSEQRIPVPWDPTFLSEWRTFVHELGRRYDSDPTLVLVKLTGLNGASEETNLPHETGTMARRGPIACFSTDDLAEWRRIHYSPDKVEHAWRFIAGTFAESFPHKKLAIMTGPSFPRVTGLTFPAGKGESTDGRMGSDLIAEGVAMYGERFVVQNNGLSAFWNWRAVASVAGRVSTGYQMLWSVTGDQQCRMNHHVTPCDPRATLDSAIDRGIAAGAEYLEIYAPDVVNPELRGLLINARARLSSRSATRGVHNSPNASPLAS